MRPTATLLAACSGGSHTPAPGTIAPTAVQRQALHLLGTPMSDAICADVRRLAGPLAALTGTAMLATACGGGPATTGSGADLGSGAACGSGPAAARVGSSTALAASKHLAAHYEPSQATGWAAPYSPTIGGHESCVQVSYSHKTYRISLLPFGQAGSSPNPVYETVPADPDVAFKKTLAQEFGRHYTFRYLGGLPSGAKFVIESYGVRLYRRAKGLVWDSDLYAIYEPGKSGPALNSDLQFIQVISTRYPSGAAGSRVDVPGAYSQAPYSGQGAGLTTVNGHQIVNFYDPGPGVLRPVSPDGGSGPQVDRLETFLAKDTGRRNAAGKKIVDIYGGIEWGFAFKTVE